MTETVVTDIPRMVAAASQAVQGGTGTAASTVEQQAVRAAHTNEACGFAYAILAASAIAVHHRSTEKDKQALRSRSRPRPLASQNLLWNSVCRRTASNYSGFSGDCRG